MAILDAEDVITNALWPQGDIRDPLGVWGFRHGVVGDASGGTVKVVVSAAAEEAAAYIYTIYSAIAVIATQAIVSVESAKLRIQTNWPNVDPQPGVQAYSSAKVVTIDGGGFTPPQIIPRTPMVSTLDRFLLIFDPRPSAGILDMLELEISTNILNDTYFFEGYGYYWDRSVLNAPGGPRHPGAS